jgi:hypothetical protein
VCMEALGLWLDVSGVDTNMHFATLAPSFQAHLTSISVERRMTPRNLFGIFGSLMWANYAVVRAPLCSYSVLLGTIRSIARDIVHRTTDWDKLVDLTDDTVDEIHQFIEEAVGAKVTLAELRQTDPCVEWWTDASDSELAWVTEEMGIPWAGGCRNSRPKIYEAELEAMVLALAEADRPVVVNCDNRAAMHALVKGHSKTEAGNQMLQWLQTGLRTRYIYVRWVPSQCNCSDPLTRGLKCFPRHACPCTHRGEIMPIRWAPRRRHLST